MTGERSLLALEARILVVQMRAREGERPATDQEAAIVQQSAKLFLQESVQRIAVALGHGFASGAGGVPEQVSQCHAQARPDLLDLVIDITEEAAQWMRVGSACSLIMCAQS